MIILRPVCRAQSLTKLAGKSGWGVNVLTSVE